MKLSVNYNEINRIAKNVDNKTVEFNRKLNELVVLIESLSSCWEGPDADTFIKNSTTYLKERKQEVNELRKLANVISNSSKRYSHSDVEWKVTVAREDEDNV